MLIDYTNQTITLWRKGTPDAYNQSVFTDGAIKCRLQNKRRVVRNAQGVEVLSTAQVFTKAEVRVGDRIVLDTIDFLVIASEPVYDLDGRLRWYEVAL